MKKERSCSGGIFEFPPSSPSLSRKSQKERQNSSHKLRYLHPANMSTLSQLVDLTVFHIPGLDVKVISTCTLRLTIYSPTY